MPRRITTALGDGDLEAVLVASDETFGNLWKAIARQIISSNKQRVADPDDISQETLAELHRFLQSGKAPFKDRGDIRRWTARVARNKSLQAVDKARRTRGPSSIECSEEKDEALLGRFAQVPGKEVTPDQLAIIQETAIAEKQLVDDISDFMEQIQKAINNCLEKDKNVLSLFLDGKGIHSVANEASAKMGVRVSDHFVKTATYAFIHETMGESVNALRKQFMKIENSVPGVATRVDIPKWAARCLTDFRSKPY